MRLLLDTHIFLWYVAADQRLRMDVRSAIASADTVFLSVASVWEATIKYGLGKLELPQPPHPWFTEQREAHGIESLPIDEASVARLFDLEPHHRDPFDRILVCQAMEHRAQIVTADPILSRYPASIFGR